MTKLPTDDDDSLVNFLKANRPEVPPATPDLEERIVQVVESKTTSPVNRFFQHDPAKCRRLWLVPPAIAVGVLFAIGSDSLRSSTLFRSSWATTTPSEAEMVSLEAFLEHNWNNLTFDSTNSISFHNADSSWVKLSNSKPKILTRSVHQKTVRR